MKVFPGVSLDSRRIGSELLNLFLERRIFLFLLLDVRLKRFIFAALVPVRKQAVRAHNAVKHKPGCYDHSSQRQDPSNLLAHLPDPVRRFAVPFQPRINSGAQQFNTEDLAAVISFSSSARDGASA